MTYQASLADNEIINKGVKPAGYNVEPWKYEHGYALSKSFWLIASASFLMQNVMVFRPRLETSISDRIYTRREIVLNIFHAVLSNWNIS